MKINCAIVDDEPTARDILEIHIGQIDSLHLIGKCKNAVEFMNLTANHKIDLLFLDINMPDITGINLAKVLDKKIKIIFTTAYREYAVDGFDLQAVDYLLKPISPERIKQSVDKYIRENAPKAGDKIANSCFIDIVSDRKTLRLDCNEIIFIESLSEQVWIHTEKEVIKTRMNISSLERLLSKDLFIRSHRAFILNKGHIKSYSKSYISIGIRDIPLSRKYKNEVLESLNAN